MKRYSFAQKLTALFLLLAFGANTVYGSVEGGGQKVEELEKNLLPSTFRLPPEYGTIEEFYLHPAPGPRTPASPAGGPVPLIFYIQDAHDSLEAQENIAKIIHHLVDKQNVKTVFEEGYEGSVPTDKYFGKILDSKLREKVAYFLMDKLRLGGAEYAHITRTQNFDLLGTDNLKLHKENIRHYQKSAKHQKQIEIDLNAIDAEIQTLAQRHFSKEMKEWMKHKERLDRGELPLLDYLTRLGFNLSPKNLPSAQELFKKIYELEDAFSKSQLKTERDQKTFHYYQSLQLLKRLNRLEVTAEEYRAFVGAGLVPAQFGQSQALPLHTMDVAKFISEQSNKSIVLSKQWEKKIHHAIAFYETAKKRDAVIEKTLTTYPLPLNASILVYGGFHKEAIKSILQRNGFSYYIISPKITSISPKHHDYYKQLMRMGYDSIAFPKLVAKATSTPRTLSFSETLINETLNQTLKIAANTPGVTGSKALPEMDLAAHSRAENRGTKNLEMSHLFHNRPTFRETVAQFQLKTLEKEKADDVLELLTEYLDPTKWKFFSDEERQFAISFSNMELSDLEREALSLDPHRFSGGIESVLNWIQTDPYLGFRDFIRNASVFFGVANLASNEPWFKDALKKWALIREIFYRWDNQPKVRSHTLFSRAETRTETLKKKIVFREFSISFMAIAGYSLFNWHIYLPWSKDFITQSSLYIIPFSAGIGVVTSLLGGYLAQRKEIHLLHQRSTLAKKYQWQRLFRRSSLAILVGAPIINFLVYGWAIRFIPAAGPISAPLSQALFNQFLLGPLVMFVFNFFLAQVFTEGKDYESAVKHSAKNLLDFSAIAFLVWFPGMYIAFLFDNPVNTAFIMSVTQLGWSILSGVLQHLDEIPFLSWLGHKSSQVSLLQHEKVRKWGNFLRHPFLALKGFYNQPWLGIYVISWTIAFYTFFFARVAYIVSPQSFLWGSILSVGGIALTAWLLADSHRFLVKNEEKGDSPQGGLPPFIPTRNEMRSQEAKEQILKLFEKIQRGRSRKIFVRDATLNLLAYRLTHAQMDLEEMEWRLKEELDEQEKILLLPQYQESDLPDHFKQDIRHLENLLKEYLNDFGISYEGFQAAFPKPTSKAREFSVLRGSLGAALSFYNTLVIDWADISAIENKHMNPSQVLLHEELHRISQGFETEFLEEGMTQYLTLKLMMIKAGQNDFSLEAMLHYYLHSEPTAPRLYPTVAMILLREVLGETNLIKAYLTGNADSLDDQDPESLWSQVLATAYQFESEALETVLLDKILKLLPAEVQQNAAQSLARLDLSTLKSPNLADRAAWTALKHNSSDLYPITTSFDRQIFAEISRLGPSYKISMKKNKERIDILEKLFKKAFRRLRYRVALSDESLQAQSLEQMGRLLEFLRVWIPTLKGLIRLIDFMNAWFGLGFLFTSIADTPHDIAKFYLPYSLHPAKADLKEAEEKSPAGSPNLPKIRELRQTLDQIIASLSRSETREKPAEEWRRLFYKNMHSYDWNIRKEAVEALGHVKNASPEILETLETALTDSQLPVANAAVTALGNLGPAASSTIPFIIRAAIRHQNQIHTKTAAEALQKIGPESILILIKTWRSTTWEYRSFAANLLVEIGQPVIPELLSILEDEEDIIIRDSAISILKRLGIDTENIPRNMPPPEFYETEFHNENAEEEVSVYDFAVQLHELEDKIIQAKGESDTIQNALTDLILFVIKPEYLVAHKLLSPFPTSTYESPQDEMKTLIQHSIWRILGESEIIRQEMIRVLLSSDLKFTDPKEWIKIAILFPSLGAFREDPRIDTFFKKTFETLKTLREEKERLCFTDVVKNDPALYTSFTQQIDRLWLSEYTLRSLATENPFKGHPPTQEQDIQNIVFRSEARNQNKIRPENRSAENAQGFVLKNPTPEEFHRLYLRMKTLLTRPDASFAEAFLGYEMDRLREEHSRYWHLYYSFQNSYAYHLPNYYQLKEIVERLESFHKLYSKRAETRHLKKFYEDALAFKKGKLDRHTIEEEAAAEIYRIYHESPFKGDPVWLSGFGILGRESSDPELKKLDAHERDVLVKSALLMSLFAMGRKNPALKDTKTLRQEVSKILSEGNYQRSAGYTVALANYTITNRAFEKNPLFAFHVLSHEIGHRLRLQHKIAIGSRAWEEYFADFQWWAFAEDILLKEDVITEQRGGIKWINYLIESIAQYKVSFEMAAQHPRGLITDTVNLGALEHVAARAREYYLRQSVPQVSDVEKNNLLHEIVAATAKLKRKISFRAGADIHQQLSEQTAQGEKPAEETILSLVKQAHLDKEEDKGRVQSDAHVFSQPLKNLNRAEIRHLHEFIESLAPAEKEKIIQKITQESSQFLGLLRSALMNELFGVFTSYETAIISQELNLRRVAEEQYGSVEFIPALIISHSIPHSPRFEKAYAWLQHLSTHVNFILLQSFWDYWRNGNTTSELQLVETLKLFLGKENSKNSQVRVTSHEGLIIIKIAGEATISAEEKNTSHIRQRLRKLKNHSISEEVISGIFIGLSAKELEAKIKSAIIPRRAEMREMDPANRKADKVYEKIRQNSPRKIERFDFDRLQLIRQQFDYDSNPVRSKAIPREASHGIYAHLQSLRGVGKNEQLIQTILRLQERLRSVIPDANQLYLSQLSALHLSVYSFNHTRLKLPSDPHLDMSDTFELVRQTFPSQVQFDEILLTNDGSIILTGHVLDSHLVEFRKKALEQNKAIKTQSAPNIFHITLGRLVPKKDPGTGVGITPLDLDALLTLLETIQSEQNTGFGEFTINQLNYFHESREFLESWHEKVSLPMATLPLKSHSITAENLKNLKELEDRLRPQKLLPKRSAAAFIETKLAGILIAGTGNDLALGFTAQMILDYSEAEKFLPDMPKHLSGLEESLAIASELMMALYHHPSGPFEIPEPLKERVRQKVNHNHSGIVRELGTYLGYESPEKAAEREQFEQENPEYAPDPEKRIHEAQENAKELEYLLKHHRNWFKTMSQKYAKTKPEISRTVNEMLRTEMREDNEDAAELIEPQESEFDPATITPELKAIQKTTDATQKLKAALQNTFIRSLLLPDEFGILVGIYSAHIRSRMKHEPEGRIPKGFPAEEKVHHLVNAAIGRVFLHFNNKDASSNLVFEARLKGLTYSARYWIHFITRKERAANAVSEELFREFLRLTWDPKKKEIAGLIQEAAVENLQKTLRDKGTWSKSGVARRYQGKITEEHIAELSEAVRQAFKEIAQVASFLDLTEIEKLQQSQPEQTAYQLGENWNNASQKWVENLIHLSPHGAQTLTGKGVRSSRIRIETKQGGEKFEQEVKKIKDLAGLLQFLKENPDAIIAHPSLAKENHGRYQVLKIWIRSMPTTFKQRFDEWHAGFLNNIQNQFAETTVLIENNKDIFQPSRSETRLATQEVVLEETIHLKNDVVFTIRQETLKILTKAQFLELIGLKMMNEEKLRIVIDSKAEQALSKRAEELVLKHKNVYLGWNPRALAGLPKNVPVIQFEDLIEGKISADSLNEKTARQINATFDLFDGTFIAAFRYAQKPSEQYQIVTAASATVLGLFNQLFKTYAIVSQAA